MNKFINNFMCGQVAASLLVCSFLLAGLETGAAQSKSEPNAKPENVSTPPIKAYKTLNFGDDRNSVEKKLSEIFDGAKASGNYSYHITATETFWRALFDTDAEYEPYKFNENYMAEQSPKLDSLMQYFKHEVEVISCKNDVITANCFLINKGRKVGNDLQESELAIVEISYKTFDQDKLTASFMQNFPNAKKEDKKTKSELPIFPGAFIEYEETIVSDINQDRKATLTIPKGTIKCTFTELAQLSKGQKAVLEKAMTQTGQTDLNEFYESTKTMISNQVKDVKPAAPKAVFASKQILGTHLEEHRKFTASSDRTGKAKLKKATDSASGF